MASRKDQKERLRKERQEREALAKAAEHRRRLIGYGAGGAVVAVVAVVLVVLLAGSGGGGGGGGGSEAVLPSGGSVPEQKVTDLEDAAKAAGCELKSAKATSREHTSDLAEVVQYESNPPTSGKHFDIPSEDDAYNDAPDAKEVVHALEHGRVVVWLKKTLPKDQRADLKALYDDDPFQVLLVPNETKMTYAVAATAWNRDPEPNGTGRLLGCPTFNPQVFDAIRTFKDEHRSNGPEAVD